MIPELSAVYKAGCNFLDDNREQLSWSVSVFHLAGVQRIDGFFPQNAVPIVLTTVGIIQMPLAI